MLSWCCPRDQDSFPSRQQNMAATPKCYWLCRHEGCSFEKVMESYTMVSENCCWVETRCGCARIPSRGPWECTTRVMEGEGVGTSQPKCWQHHSIGWSHGLNKDRGGDMNISIPLHLFIGWRSMLADCLMHLPPFLHHHNGVNYFLCKCLTYLFCHSSKKGTW